MERDGHVREMGFVLKGLIGYPAKWESYIFFVSAHLVLQHDKSILILI